MNSYEEPKRKLGGFFKRVKSQGPVYSNNHNNNKHAKRLSQLKFPEDLR